MTVSARRVGVALVILASLLGCRSALQEPPPVDRIGSAGQTVEDSSLDAASLIGAGDEAFARRPDAAKVARAQSLYLDAAAVDGAPVTAFLGAARTTSWLVEHSDDDARRRELVVQGVQIGQWCQRLHPEVVECAYRLALAVGQQARERASTATDGLDVMVDLLERVINEDPELDYAGGHRVLGLLLLRAPGWPTGPGDPETGLEHARAAVELAPDYPPNQLVLAEALAENGDRAAAVDALERGIGLARSGRSDPEAADWVARAETALADLR